MAGNFGWPYFVGNNYAYAEWDFATNSAGALYNPAAPVNNSPNNTGLTSLPPATPAMIWYPYAPSAEFPELGQGGRSAMAGSFYNYDKAKVAGNGFPEYYDGGLFVFEWMRNWVMVLRFDGNENYLRSEAFMSNNGDFRRPIDLVFSNEGVMYMLEYGSVYGADNEDARLVKIEYNTGNRAPIAKASVVDSVAQAERQAKAFITSENRDFPTLREAAGKAPLRVKFSSRGTADPDDTDEIEFQWLFDGKTVGSVERNPTHIFTVPGLYRTILLVRDQAGETATDTLVIQVGNERPRVSIEVQGNKSFFWENEPFINYTVKVEDDEDKTIDPADMKVYFDYIPSPSMIPSNQPGHQAIQTVAGAVGSSLIAASDCKACHTLKEVSVGPSYTAVAERYKGQKDAVDMLANKIIEGGGGNWGTTHVMAAHPQIPLEDAREIVKYILSLGEPQKQQRGLAPAGRIALKSHKKEEPRGIYTLTASYADKGGSATGSLTGAEVVTLRNAKVRSVFADGLQGFPRWGNSISQGDHKSHVMLRNIDLTGIKGFTFEYAADKKDGFIEVRLDSYAGPVISKTDFKATGSWGTRAEVRGELVAPLTGKHDLYFFIMKPEKPNEDLATLQTITFEK